MQLKKLIFLLVILSFSFPTTANAGDIDVNTGNVRVRTQQNGSISVNTGRNQIQVDRAGTNTDSWWRSWYYWNRGRRSCNSSTYQRSTQTTTVNGRTRTYSNSTSTCR